jgi:hypothetical protein
MTAAQPLKEILSGEQTSMKIWLPELGTFGAGLVSELRKRGYHVVFCDIAHQPDGGGILRQY